MLDFRMETFLAVCRHLNYTRAAEELNITQPAVTQHIQYLQAHYGARLLDYRDKRLTLTPEGEALRRAAHALKNSAATLCFEELRLRAAALEQAARQVLADTPENATGLGSLAAACAGALARAEEALRRDNG